MSLRNVLVIKLRYLGDVLLATPALRALKAAHPQARLTVIVNRGTEEILIGNPDVDEVVPLEKTSLMAQMRLVSHLRRRPFDAVIDLTDADRSAFLSWASGAPVRIGFNDEDRWRGGCYTTVVLGDREGHRIERDLAALTPLGVTTADAMPRVWLSAEDDRRADELSDRLGVRMDRKIVILQPGARYWFKAWPAERFAELADRLTAEYGCQIIIGGSRGEVDLARQVAGYAKSRLIPMTDASVKQFAAVAKRAILFIGNDSGAMHIAAAVGAPVIGLFGPSNPREWGPRGERVIALYKGLDCRACFHPTCNRGELNCMRQISVDEVFEAGIRLIEPETPHSMRCMSLR
jgi:predicted lipopolysaccharide heptosyltransferase III